MGAGLVSRFLARLLTAFALVGGLLVLAPAGPAPASAAPTFGGEPLDAVLHWASEEARCGLTPNRLAAMMLAPTYPETGAPSGSSPSPMTLSRYDDDPGLFSFGTVAGQPKAFWHPGVGAWQFDSAGLGAPYTAAQAIDTYVISAQAADTMAARWCTNPTLAYVWAPWYGCGTRTCKDIYDTIYRVRTDRLVNVTRDATVHRRGGMVRHTCTGVARTGRFACWRVDPREAEGHAAFAAPGFSSRTPITAPFYVYAANGKEYRHWLRADTGYRRGIWASRPLGANARSALTWHRGDGLVDLGPGRAGGGGGEPEPQEPEEPEEPACTGFCDVPVDAWYEDALDWAVDGEVVSGFADGTFRPGDAVTRAQVVSWLWTLAGEPLAAAPHGFGDVRDTAWFDDALSWAAGEGLVSGFSDGTFRAGDAVTRAQFASMLWNLADRPTARTAVSFSDVRPSAWYAEAVSWLVDLGWVEGFRNGTFRPLEPVNRAQAVSWLHAGRRFDDVVPTAWYASAVDWARYRDLVDGFPDHTFRGDLVADRATTVDLLWRTMDAPTAPAHGFSDVTAGQPAVSWASAAGIVNGFPDGTFRPGDPVNRAQAVMMLWKVAGQPAVSGPPPFSDVPANAWYAAGVTWASSHDLLDGFLDGTFRPGEPVNRSQLTAWSSALAHTQAAWAPGVTPPGTVVFG